jgi:hypothetical protein
MLTTLTLITLTLAGCGGNQRRAGTAADWDRIRDDQEQADEHADEHADANNYWQRIRTAEARAYEAAERVQPATARR